MFWRACPFIPDELQPKSEAGQPQTNFLLGKEELEHIGLIPAKAARIRKIHK